LEDHASHRKVFLKVLITNVAVFLAELTIALYSGSLTMLSDSFHVFIHIFSSIIAYISETGFLKLEPAKLKKYSALINVNLFFISAGVILKKAVERLDRPLDLEIGWLFFVIASLGLFANMYGAN